MEPCNSSFVVNNANHSGDTLWKLVKNSSSESSFIISFVDFIITSLCALGTPGNLFVVFVYLRRMTTALRTYMFALGIADTLTCVPFIILQIRRLGIGDDRLFAVIADILVSSRVFSALMLAYLSVDRFLFAIRPHTFGRNIRKAKVSLVTIATVSVLYTALLKVTQLSGLQQVHVIIAAFFAHLCFVTVIMSYSLLAVTLLKRTRAALRKIDVAALVGADGATFSRYTFTSHLTSLITTNMPVVPPVQPDTRGITSEPMTAKPSKAEPAKRTTLTMFVVTASNALLWMPFFLTNYGFSLPEEFTRVFTINSVVNPYIYLCVSPMYRSDVRQVYRDIRSRLTICCRHCCESAAPMKHEERNSWSSGRRSRMSSNTQQCVLLC